MNEALTNLAYLVASVLFIFGLKGLTRPRTAVRGNLTSAVGMLLAVVVVLLDQKIVGYTEIIIGLVIGGAIGAFLAAKIQMTAMPQLVAMFNGLGGSASLFVAGAELFSIKGDPGLQTMIAGAATGLIGAVTFWGSLVAYAKLQEIKAFKKPWHLSGQQVINGVLTVICVVLGVWLVMQPEQYIAYWLLAAVASLLGIMLVMPIGAADMPVVIALLNSYSGLAATATGFVLSNNMLIIAGSLVGASGLILTSIMCKAMNRSLANVLFGVMGPTADTPDADEVYAGKVKSTSAEEVAMLMDGVRRVVVVPGYGMAVAQCQHAVEEMFSLLMSRGVDVQFGIHPVAGRMPGHMNVLLAEADIPYDHLKDLADINPMFTETDVAIVLGANDVVNPEARMNPDSPIAGMPILDVDYAGTVVVIKRSLSPGFAGIPNPLFANDNTLMYFGDGKKAVQDLITALKEG
jgi:NAD(P) transhydrogenase subunit beta